MKIVLVGGGTGGHFYPLIAVAEALEDIVETKRLIAPEIFYIGPKPFDPPALLEHDIEYRSSPAGKLRQYSSIMNFFDGFKTLVGIIRSLFQLFGIYPDVIFSTGGYAAFPTLYAARILGIPVITYDADATPGKVTLWSAKFARWIAVAHPIAAKKFPERYHEKIANIGHPIRKEIQTTTREGGHEFLNLKGDVPTLFIMGGSQGAQSINEVVLDALPELLNRYNVVHQTGAANLEGVRGIASVSLREHRFRERYRTFGLLNTLAIRMTAGISDLIIARAGSGTIFEVAAWKIPSILVPLPIDISHDQTENAFSYARSGAAVVIEQHNLSQHVLIAEVDRLIQNQPLRETMKEAAGAFAKPEAAKKVAEAIIEVALEHEPR